MSARKKKNNIDTIDKQTDSFLQFHSNEAKSILEKFRNIEVLIGTNHHNPSDGYHCEILLKEHLRKQLPKRYSVDTGFICNWPIEIDSQGKPDNSKKKGFSVSPQIDIIIHDEYQYPPIYRTGDYVVVLPDSVKAVIEVKKELNSSNFRSALKNLNIIQLLIGEGKFYGIFSFTAKNKKLNFVKKQLNNSFFLPTVSVLDTAYSLVDEDKNVYTVFNAYSGNKDYLISLQLFCFQILRITSGITKWNFHSFRNLASDPIPLFQLIFDENIQKYKSTNQSS